MSKQHITRTRKAEIMPKTITDHNPVMWKETHTKYQWKLNEQLLNREENIQKLKEETEYYFNSNLGKEVLIQHVWEASKAVIRGNLMKMGQEYEKNKEKEIEDIPKQIKTKELEVVKDPKSEVIRNEIKMLQDKLQNTLNEEMEKNMKFVKQKFFAGADR